MMTSDLCSSILREEKQRFERRRKRTKKNKKENKVATPVDCTGSLANIIENTLNIVVKKYFG